jgi:hypothetical protein
VLFLLRIGDEPLPQLEELPHAITLNVAEMKALMDELPEMEEGIQAPESGDLPRPPEPGTGP